jgi:hypothetical protein
MKYALLIYGEDQAWAEASEEERAGTYAEHGRLAGALRARNAILGGEQLQPASTATTVQTQQGRSILTDGPFAETREQLGGFYLIEAADLDEALGYAKMLSGTVEVRPVLEHGG